MSQRARVFAPASIGNVGPGFDVLGLAVDGIGDHVTVELVEGASRVTVGGRDAALLPTEPSRNAAFIAAHAMLQHLGRGQPALHVHVDKGLAVAGGMGGSAASSVGGALAAALAVGHAPSALEVMETALAGESAVAGRHLDNIAPCVLGGLVLLRSVSPIDAIPVKLARPLFAAMVTPRVQVETRAARALLPPDLPRAEWLHQVAHTAALVLACSTGDLALLGRALDDRFAEPRRAGLIPHFHDVKRAALHQGALGCSISGSGPTVFALCESESVARRVADAMHAAFVELAGTFHVGAIDVRGARAA